MSNIEEVIRDRKQGRAYRTPPEVQHEGSTIELELEGFTRSLLDTLAAKFAVSPEILAAELFKAAIIDAHKVAGNSFPDDDEITEHYGERARKRFDEMG